MAMARENGPGRRTGQGRLLREEIVRARWAQATAKPPIVTGTFANRLTLHLALTKRIGWHFHVFFYFFWARRSGLFFLMGILRLATETFGIGIFCVNTDQFLLVQDAGTAPSPFDSLICQMIPDLLGIKPQQSCAGCDSSQSRPNASRTRRRSECVFSDTLNEDK